MRAAGSGFIVRPATTHVTQALSSCHHPRSPRAKWRHTSSPFRSKSLFSSEPFMSPPERSPPMALKFSPHCPNHPSPVQIHPTADHPSPRKLLASVVRPGALLLHRPVRGGCHVGPGRCDALGAGGNARPAPRTATRTLRCWRHYCWTRRPQVLQPANR